MKVSKKQDKDSGQTQENVGRPLSQESRQKKTVPEKRKVGTKAESKTGFPFRQSSGNKSNNTSVKGRKATSKTNGAMPVPKPTKSRNWTAEALKRLKVTPEQLSKVPEISDLFKEAKGGLKGCIQAMRFAIQDETIATFLRKYDSIPEIDRTRLSWEAIAVAAGLDTRLLAGAIMVALKEKSVTSVNIIALTSHPDVMRSTVKYAQSPSGEKDRSMVHLAQGYLPSPKPPTFIGKALFGMPDNLSALGKGRDDAEDGTPMSENEVIDQLFPSPVKTQEKLVAIRQRLLPTG
jgi:hypothetical protein